MRFVQTVLTAALTAVVVMLFAPQYARPVGADNPNGPGGKPTATVVRLEVTETPRATATVVPQPSPPVPWIPTATTVVGENITILPGETYTSLFVYTGECTRLSVFTQPRPPVATLLVSGDGLTAIGRSPGFSPEGWGLSYTGGRIQYFEGAFFDNGIPVIGHAPVVAPYAAVRYTNATGSAWNIEKASLLCTP